MRCGAFHRVEGTLCLARHGQAALSGSKTKAPGVAGGCLLESEQPIGLILRLHPERVETKEAMGLKASTTGSRTAPHPTQNRITVRGPVIHFRSAPGDHGLLAVARPGSVWVREFRLLRCCGREGGSGGTKQLLEEIVGSQHHRSFSLDWPFEELSRCSLLNRIAQPHKLIYSLICLHITLAFKIVHRRGADRTPHCLSLISHREINDHPIEVVAQYFTSLQLHCKTSVLKGS